MPIILQKKYRDALKTVIESNGVNPNLKDKLLVIYERIGGNNSEVKSKSDILSRQGESPNLSEEGDYGDAYSYRVR